MELLTLFSLLVKYNAPFINKEQCVSDIQQWFMRSGSVWQKFAQVLSQCEDIVGKDLADALSKICFECPAHDHNYSARIIRDAFGEKYETKKMTIVGSGTISQVYKVYDKSSDKFVAIKVMHPNVKREIKEACDAYNKIKHSQLMPYSLTILGKLFCARLKEQLLMNKEFKNGKLFKKSLQPTNNRNCLFVIPEMIEYSKKCLVTSYEESNLLANHDFEPIILYKICDSIRFLNAKMTVCGFMHSDLHKGNIGFRKHDCKIILYDYGDCADITQIDRRIRIQIAKFFLYKDADKIALHTVIKESYDVLAPILNKSFSHNMRVLTSTVFTSDVAVSNDVLKLFMSWSKTKSIGEAMIELRNKYNLDYRESSLTENRIKQYIDEYLPYQEFDSLREL